MSNLDNLFLCAFLALIVAMFIVFWKTDRTPRKL